MSIGAGGSGRVIDRLRLDGHAVESQAGVSGVLPVGTEPQTPDQETASDAGSTAVGYAIDCRMRSGPLDFMSDALYVGRRFRTLNVLDEGMREGLTIEIDTSLPGERVVRVLERLCAWRGVPEGDSVRQRPGADLTGLRRLV